MSGSARITAPGAVSLVDVPLPEPGPGQLRVRLEGCGVCGSNGPVWEGRPWFTYPLEPGAPGHEGWGRVDRVGPGVTGCAEGERVTLLSYHAYAEFDVASASDVVSLPPALDGIPFPGEALGCAMNVYRRSDVRPGQNVAVIGIGFLGALLVQLAARGGACVTAVSRRPRALEMARAFGAEDAIPLEPGVAARLMERTQGRGYERVIEAVGVQETLDLAGELTAERGRLVIAGYHQDGRRTVDLQSWNWRGIDVVNAHERDPATYVEGMRAAVQAVTDGGLDFLPLMTHEFELKTLDRGLDAMRRRPDGFMKAWIRT